MPYSPIQPDGDGRHDERVPEEQRRRFGRQVAAEILKEQVLLGLLLGAAFGSHGRAEDWRPGAGSDRAAAAGVRCEAKRRARNSGGADVKSEYNRKCPLNELHGQTCPLFRK